MPACPLAIVMFAFAERVTLFECQACYQLSPCVANRQQHLENLEQYRVVKGNIQDICYPPIATMTPAYAFPMTLILPPSGGPYGYTFTSMAYYHRDPKMVRQCPDFMRRTLYIWEMYSSTRTRKLQGHFTSCPIQRQRPFVGSKKWSKYSRVHACWLWRSWGKQVQC